MRALIRRFPTRLYLLALTSLVTALFMAYAIALLVSPAHAQHEAAGESNSIQHVVTHAEVTLVGNAAAADLCGGSNKNRVTAIIQNTGSPNNMRAGDSSTAAARGIIIISGGAASFDSTDKIYGFSAVGTTVSCLEIERGS